MKSPYIKWDEFKAGKAPTEAQVKQWWQKWPQAMIGLVTGISNKLSVIDFDIYKLNDLQAEELVSKFIGFHDIKTPTAITPNGGYHFYFKYHAEIPQGQDIYPNVDGRNNGGYIVVPPSSVNGDGGKYSWVENKNIANCALAPIPPQWLQLIKEYMHTSYRATTTNNNSLSLSLSLPPPPDVSNASPPSYQAPTLLTTANRYFKEGRRDDDLFHAANCLVKGGADLPFTWKALELIANNLGNEFGPAVVKQKIESVLKRVARRETNISKEVREWVLLTDRSFNTNILSQELTFTNRTQKQAMYVALGRLCEEGIIEKYGDKRGGYRKIDSSINEQPWWEENDTPLKIRFPLGIHKYAKTYPGNIILLEGQKSQGKSSFALEFCRLNWDLFKNKVRYQNIEMSGSELIERFHAYEREGLASLDDWKNRVMFIRQTEGWWDKIEPNGINVVDYLVEYEKAYLIAQFVFKIHEKLKKGVALILVQRDPYKPYPSGGLSVRNIPRTIISLMHHKAKIEDAKSFYTTQGNPNGLQIQYNHVNWCQFVPDGDWYRAEDEKYSHFARGVTR